MATIAELQAVLGDEALHRLVQARGGELLYVPSWRFCDRSSLAELLGHQACLMLCQKFGCEKIAVPKLARQKAAARDADILVAAAAGASNDALAKRYRLSERTIRRILAMSAGTDIC